MSRTVEVKCKYIDSCSRAYRQCDECANNIMRNYIEDHFIKAYDNPIPEICPPLKYDGPEEQTKGYTCPVCEGFTRPQLARNGVLLCVHCGYKLNMRGI